MKIAIICKKLVFKKFTDKNVIKKIIIIIRSVTYQMKFWHSYELDENRNIYLQKFVKMGCVAVNSVTSCMLKL